MSRWPFVLSLTALLGLSAVLIAQPEPGKTGRPFLGVAVAPAKDTGEGVVIREVAPDSPAAKAGLKDGDVVIKLNSKDVPDVSEFLRSVGTHKPGDKLNVQVQRDGLDKTIAVTLGTRAAAAPGSGAPPGVPGIGPGGLKGLLQPPALLGVQAEPLTPELRMQLKVKTEAGVVVADVLPNSPAAKAGVERNDVIVTVSGQAVKDPEELRAAVQKAGAGKTVTLHLQRGEKDREVKVALRSGALEGGDPLIRPRPPIDIEGLMDQSGKVRDLERRIDALEKRLKELEKRSGPSSK